MVSPSLRRVNISRSIKSIAIFEVNRDKKLVLLDLKVLGFKIAKSSYRVEKYTSYFRVLDDFILSLGMKDFKGVYRDSVCYYMSKPVLCRFYYEGTNLVKRIILASFYPGIIKNLIQSLENNYWKRLFFFEIMRLRQQSRGIYFPSGEP